MPLRSTLYSARISPQPVVRRVRPPQTRCSHVCNLSSTFPHKCALASELLEVSTFALAIDCVWSLRLSVMDSGGSHGAVPIALPFGHHGLHQLADLGRCIS